MENYTNITPSSERLSEEYLAVNSCGIEKLYKIDQGSKREKGRIDYHILYIEHGVCYLESNDTTQEVGSGHIILFRPGEPQCYYFRAADRSISHYIHFTGVGCEELLNKLGIDNITVFNMGGSGTYEEISNRMTREYTLKRKHWESFTTGCLYELLSLIARKYAFRHDNISHESEHLISIACRKIYDNLATPPHLSELAADAHLSVSRFSHLFNEVVGKSPKEFIISFRIERSCELLETSEMSIKEVSEAVGFSDQNYFSRIFKKRVGCSPREFRKKF